MARYVIAGNVSTIPAVNAELEKIKVAIDDTLSRKADSPNQMEGDFDANSNRILNLPAPINNSEPLRKADLPSLSITTSTDTTLVVSTVAAMILLAQDVGTRISVKRYYALGDLVEDLIYDVQTGTGDGYINHTMANGTTFAKLVSFTDAAQAGFKPEAGFNNSPILNAIAFNKLNFTKAGTYFFNTQVTLPSNSQLIVNEGCKLQASTDDFILLLCTSKSNIDIRGKGTISGSGTAFSASDDGVRFTLCTNITIKEISVTQFNGIGVYLYACSRSKVTGINAFNNSIYGIQDREGTNNIIKNNWLYNNGKTTAGTNTFGRGLVTWICTDGIYSNNIIYGNTEYGLRAYSQTADASGTHRCVYDNNIIYDNGNSGNVELFVFNEGGEISNNAFTNNIVIIDGVKTTVGIAVQGTDNIFDGNLISNSNNNQTGDAYQLFGAIGCVVNGGIVKGTANVMGFSGSTLSDDIVITNIKATNVSKFIPSLTDFGGSGKGYKIHGNSARFGGSGTHTALTLTLQSNGFYDIESNTFDGFNKGILSGNSASKISNNTTLNSGTLGFDISTPNEKVELFGNSFDSCFPNSKGNMSTGKIGTQGKRITSSNVSPSADSRASSWSDGDFCHKTTVAVDANNRIQIGWICTVAGTPGTWVNVFVSDSTFT